MIRRDAVELVDLIDDLIKERVDHALSNRHNHEYPSSEEYIYRAQEALVDYLETEPVCLDDAQVGAVRTLEILGIIDVENDGGAVMGVRK